MTGSIRKTIIGLAVALAAAGLVVVSAQAAPTPRAGVALASGSYRAVLGAQFDVSRFTRAAQTEGGFVGCLNGNTVRHGDDMSTFLNWLAPEDAFAFILDQEVADIFRNRIAANGGSWTFMVFDTEGTVVTGPKVITEGACGGAGVFSDRSFWLCFSKSRNPALYSRGEAVDLYANGGYTVPYAVQSAVSDTNIGNGVYLTCELPAGMSVKPGIAVSTGGGDIFTGPPELVSYMLTNMPLDYTTFVGP